MTQIYPSPCLINHPTPYKRTHLRMPREFCRDFSNVICPRRMCPFQHVPDRQSVKAFPDQYFPTRATIGSSDCPDFPKGECLRGTMCSLKHRRHFEDTPIHATPIPTKAWHNEHCSDFLAGRCPQGFWCPYVHLPPETPNIPKARHFLKTDAQFREYCGDFLAGCCLNRKSCQYIHPAPPKPPMGCRIIALIPTDAIFYQYCSHGPGRCPDGLQCPKIHYLSEALSPPHMSLDLASESLDAVKADDTGASPHPAQGSSITLGHQSSNTGLDVMKTNSSRQGLVSGPDNWPEQAPDASTVGSDGASCDSDAQSFETALSSIPSHKPSHSCSEATPSLPGQIPAWKRANVPPRFAHKANRPSKGKASTSSIAPDRSKQRREIPRILMPPAPSETPQVISTQSESPILVRLPPSKAAPNALSSGSVPKQSQAAESLATASSAAKTERVSTTEDEAKAPHVLSGVGGLFSGSKRDTYQPQIRPHSGEVTLKLKDHLLVRLGSGFHVEEVIITGAESSWVVVRNLPGNATRTKLMTAFKKFGDVQDIRFTEGKDIISTVAHVQFSSGEEARTVKASLAGAKVLGNQVDAQVPLSEDRGKMVLLQDATLRVEWDAPQRIAYGGYKSDSHADKAFAAAASLQLEHPVVAQVHLGTPGLGKITLKFLHVPPDADAEFMKQLGEPESVAFEKPNYLSKEGAIDGIKRTLSKYEGFTAFELQQQISNPGRIRGLAYFTSSSCAQAAAQDMHGRKPRYTGGTRITLRHTLTMTFKLNSEVFLKVREQISEIQPEIPRPSSFLVISPYETGVLIRLGSQDAVFLGRLKTLIDNIIRGDIVRHNDGIVWSPFFTSSDGHAFIRELLSRHMDVTIDCHARRKTIYLFGPKASRQAVKDEIVLRWTALEKQRCRSIPIARRILALFLTSGLPALQKAYGTYSIHLDLWTRTLEVRGPDPIYQAAIAAVQDAHERAPRFWPGGHRRHSDSQCPICLNTVLPSSKVMINACGHLYCRSCLADYIRSATSHRYFPLTCLGGDASCKARIPLSIAYSVLVANEYEAVAEAALNAYMDSKPDEFKHCPTPDCQQIYRPMAEGNVIQCPSCLTRICPHCHVVYHDHVTCAEFGVEPDAAFEHWVQESDVKSCPGCNVLIERGPGCNHMACTRCSTHFCWVCLKSFPDKGKGIYEHMSKAHGGWGLLDEVPAF